MTDAQQPLNALPQGHRLQEYELVRVLGFGGFGMTYLGFDHNLDKAVAIKEYLPSDIATRTSDNSVVPQASQFQDDFEWGLDRFLDEARALARFDHRHIIKVHRFFEAHGTAYIVMEYAEGETLSAFLERKGTLTETELKAILYPLLDGLEVVHRADFLHRDIKPGNIIIRDEDNSPVLLDFGSARQAIGARSRSVTSIITPGYAPIEQYSSRGDQGSWTDIYALGGVCYSALTGQVPEDATDRVRNDPLIPVSERCAGQASSGFLSAIDWALAVDEGDRPQSIGVWRTALEEETPRIVSAQPPVTTPALPLEKKKREAVVSRVGSRDASLSERGQKARGKLLAVVISMVAVLIVGIIYIVQAEKQRQELVAEKAKIESEKAILAAEQAEKQRQEQAILEKLRQEGAALEKQRQEQAAEKARLAEKQRQEEAALEKQRQELAAEKARLAAELAEKQRQEQAAEKARLTAEQAEKQRQEQAFVAEVGRKPQPQGKHNGETDLHIAAKLNLPMLTIFLLKAGADVHAKDNNGNTPLHWAAYKDASATAEILLKSGADINAKNNEGRTPLHSATLQDASATVGVLLKAGADVHAITYKGNTPLRIATANNAFETAKLLRRYGAYR